MELFIQNAYHFTIFNHFFNKRVFYGMKILALINLVHFYIILDTFIRFPHAFIRQQAYFRIFAKLFTTSNLSSYFEKVR